MLSEDEEVNGLGISPAEVHGAQKLACSVMKEPPIRLYIPLERRIQVLIKGRDPVHNCGLERFGVVGSRTPNALRDLSKGMSNVVVEGGGGKESYH